MLAPALSSPLSPGRASLVQVMLYAQGPSGKASSRYSPHPGLVRELEAQGACKSHRENESGRDQERGAVWF